MKIKLNNAHLHGVVLKQIVDNASVGMKIEREMTLIDRLIPFTRRSRRLKSLMRRNQKLWIFEKSLKENESDLVEIDFKDADFIYSGYRG